MRISELLPHAAPMILLTDYEEPSSDDAVSAFIEIDAAAPFFDRACGGVPACVALEYMAQAMALLVGLRDRRRGEKPRIGFVLGSRKLETFIPSFREGARYRVSVACTYEDESFGSFDCLITDAAGTVAAKATMTAFQPEGAMTAERLKEFA